MKKNRIWYAGMVLAIIIAGILFFTDLPELVDIILSIVFAVLFSISNVEILHSKMLKTDQDYKIEILDERHIAIKEKAGNITNMINILLVGAVTVVFIAMDYIIPAILTGIVIFVQPIIFILVSNQIEKKM